MREGDAAQLRRFRELVQSEARRTTADGRPPFTVPLAECSRDAAAVRLDQLSFGSWLLERGIDSPPLLWFLEYGTRDDYGSGINETSAWAGLHYFASRASEERFEWSEGNGHIVRMLAERIRSIDAHHQDGEGGVGGAAGGAGAAGGGRGRGVLRTSSLVYSIEAVSPSGGSQAGGVLVSYAQRPPDGGRTAFHRLRADRVVYAAPLFTARHVLRGSWGGAAATWLGQFSYSPWVVANVHLRAPPDSGARCDNVIYRASGLGYTLSTAFGGGVRGGSGGGLAAAARAVAAAVGLASDGGGAVLTYYRALSEEAPEDARRRMLGVPWDEWQRRILSELREAHPNIDALATRLDVRLIGHAMARPTPGLIWGAARAAAAAARPFGVVHFAHSDLSALPLFEEAVYWGTRVAAEVALALPRVPPGSATRQ